MWRFFCICLVAMYTGANVILGSPSKWASVTVCLEINSPETLGNHCFHDHSALLFLTYLLILIICTDILKHFMLFSPFAHRSFCTAALKACFLVVLYTSEDTLTVFSANTQYCCSILQLVHWICLWPEEPSLMSACLGQAHKVCTSSTNLVCLCSCRPPKHS